MATRRKAAASHADAVDEQLARYRSMRDFGITAEPSGDAKKPTKPKQEGLPFVIQKHAATRLHYDFRLGWNGVLKSWAVAKGPSYVVADKRLAVQVEDHPMEYGGFEGIIPKGQYGGGTVMVWDQGSWEPQSEYPDVDEGLRAGSLKFILHGTKLKGKWALIRMKGKAAKEAKPNWLLIKEHDDFERPAGAPPITDEEPNSAVTGRSLEEIAQSEDHVWNSKDTATGKAWYRRDEAKGSEEKVAKTTSAVKSAARGTALNFSRQLRTVPKEELPDFIQPQQASSAGKPPNAAGWIHELKLDGYRIQARKDGRKVQILTRTGLDWTHRMKSIAAAVAKLPTETFLADGEVVVLGADGNASFADLQAAFQNETRESASKPMSYFLFDLLHLDGYNLRGLPLLDRKNLLAKLLENSGETVRFSEHLEAAGELVFQKAAELGAEGIISKRANSQYTSGRSATWLKSKCVQRQELVIGGFTLPSNGGRGVGALLLGYYREKKLIYAGRTGTGFTEKTHKTLRDRLEKLRQSFHSFEKVPVDARKGAIWVKPQLVAQINFANWSADDIVRQASFQGLREDKPATEVVREPAATIPKPVQKANASHLAPPATAAAKVAPAKHPSGQARQGTSEHPPIRLTHPDKILDPASQLTKQQLADYYWAIAPWMLPHIAGRPLSLVRCPDGVGHPCFFQKHANSTLPASIQAVEVRDKKTGKLEPYITLSTPAALAELAQMGVLEVHPWGSRNDDLEHPDRITIDLDPDESVSWRTLAASAAEVRKRLTDIGLKSFLKTTGGKGLHIVVPIEPEHDWPVVKQFVHDFALAMEKQNPALYLIKMSKAARKDRIFIDYLRNERGATAVAAYSPRSRPGSAVSLPLSWNDLKLPQRPIFRVVDFAEWKHRLKPDPWKELPQCRQSLPVSGKAAMTG
jgi:bifunctional non-homologous end joining protein LigD